MSISSITAIKNIISLDIKNAMRRVAGAHAVADPDALAQELLIHLGVVERSEENTGSVMVAPPPPVVVDGESVDGGGDKKERKRTVSAKQKKDFMAIEGATEENLKAVIKGYKAASQETIDGLMTADSKENAFILFAKSVLSPAPVAEVHVQPQPQVEVEVKEKKAPKTKTAKKEASRVKFNATELKIFKKIVESAGSVVSDELKQEFVDYVTPMTAEEFGVVALEGHMRAFVDNKKQQVVAEAEAEAAVPPPQVDDEDEEEDVVEFDFNGETLSKGVVSGKIFRSTAEAGDVQVGVCGQGQFKDVKV
jgi:hypothetical protein